MGLTPWCWATKPEAEEAVRAVDRLNEAVKSAPEPDPCPDLDKRVSESTNEGSCQLAGGATGAKILTAKDGTKWIAKQLGPLQKSLAHYTIQTHLPKLSDNFSYSNINELVIPALAEEMGLQDLVPHSKKQCIFFDVNSEKGCQWKINETPCQDYALVAFQEGKQDLAPRESSLTVGLTLSMTAPAIGISSYASQKNEQKRKIHESKMRLIQAQKKDPDKEKVTLAALFSLLIGNIDLHSENVLVNKKSKNGLGLTLIDFGLTMPIKNPAPAERHKTPVFSEFLQKETLNLEALEKFKDKLKSPERLASILRARYQEEKVNNEVIEQIVATFYQRVEYIQKLPASVTFEKALAILDPNSKDTLAPASPPATPK